MTLNEAFKQFTESTAFKDIVKLDNSQGAKYRVYFSRFKAGKLKSGAIVELLINNGYKITANRATKRNV